MGKSHIKMESSLLLTLVYCVALGEKHKGRWSVAYAKLRREKESEKIKVIGSSLRLTFELGSNLGSWKTRGFLSFSGFPLINKGVKSAFDSCSSLWARRREQRAKGKESRGQVSVWFLKGVKSLIDLPLTAQITVVRVHNGGRIGIDVPVKYAALSFEI